MGVYVDLKINKLSLLTWKSFFDSKTLGLFFTDDNLIIDEVVIDGEIRKRYRYSTTVKAASDRLDSIGYTIKRFEHEFSCKKYQALDYSKYLYDKNVDFEKQEEVIKERVDKYITIRKWKNSITKYLKFLLNNDVYDFLLREKQIPQELNPKNESDKIIYNSIFNEHNESFFGCYYEEFDCLNTIRFILANCNQEDLLEIDISEMVGWTYESIEDMRIGDVVPKTIVLVEGKTDKEILEFALKNIYPHLYNLYYFMDFEYVKGQNRQGGCDAIAHNVKTFIASKIDSKFIAVFDNDTIGNHSKEKLVNEIGQIPNNFKILTYPNLKKLNHYPTIGTNNKIIFDNINGRACSIELYLPEEFLKNTLKSYIPIKWTSFCECKIGNKKLSDFQGVISEKEKVLDNFRKYEQSVLKGAQKFDITIFDNLKKLLDEIVTAFIE